jgi:hypothetical protein
LKTVSGIENKVEELDQTVKDHERQLRKHKWNMKDVFDTMKKPNLQIMGVEGEETQTKGTDNLFTRIGESFPNLEKERVTQVQEAYRTPKCQDQKRNTPRYIIIKTISTQNKERILKLQKREEKSHIKANPLE